MDIENETYPILAKRFKVGNLDSHVIGKGSSGIVRIGYDLTRKTIIAIKYIVSDCKIEIRREFNIIKYKQIITNQYIVSPIAIIQSKGRNNFYLHTIKDYNCPIICSESDCHEEKFEAILGSCSHPVNVLIMEHQFNDLRNYIQNINDYFCLKKIYKSFYGLLRGINEIHGLGIIHRDLKPENLFLTNKDDQYLRIGDFGLSRKIDTNELTAYVVTRWYRSPEVLENVLKNNKTYSYAIDIYSIALCIIEMMIGYPLLQGTSCIDQLFKIEKTLGKNDVINEILNINDDTDLNCNTNRSVVIYNLITQRYKDELNYNKNIFYHLSDLLSRMLNYDPSNRPSALNALNHSFFCYGKMLNYHDI